jgi:hypothetical protein
VWDGAASRPVAFVRASGGNICDASQASPGGAFGWTCDPYVGSSQATRGRPTPFFNSADHRVDVFYRGMDDGLYTIAKGAQGYTGRTALGGTLSSEPTVIGDMGGSHPRVFFVDSAQSYQLYTIVQGPGGTWPAAASLLGNSGVLVGSAAALLQLNGPPDYSQATVFARTGSSGAMDAMGSTTFLIAAAPSQAQWVNNAGVLTAGPAPAINADGHVSVMVRGTSNHIHEFVNGNYSLPIGSMVANSTPVVSRVGDGRLVVFIWSGSDLYYAVQVAPSSPT